MKTLNAIKKTFLFLSFIAVAITSCKKDKNEEPDNNATGGAVLLTAKNYGFDGGSSGEFKATAAGAVKLGPLLTISAIKTGTNQSISIVLSNVTRTGEFDLDAGNSDGNGAIISKDYTKPADATLNYSTDLPSGSGVIGGGKVTLTKLTDTEIAGTFVIIGHNSAGKDAFAEQGSFSGKLTSK